MLWSQPEIIIYDRIRSTAPGCALRPFCSAFVPAILCHFYIELKFCFGRACLGICCDSLPEPACSVCIVEVCFCNVGLAMQRVINGLALLSLCVADPDIIQDPLEPERVVPPLPQ